MFGLAVFCFVYIGSTTADLISVELDCWWSNYDIFCFIFDILQIKLSLNLQAVCDGTRRKSGPTTKWNQAALQPLFIEIEEKQDVEKPFCIDYVIADNWYTQKGSYYVLIIELIRHLFTQLGSEKLHRFGLDCHQK